MHHPVDLNIVYMELMNYETSLEPAVKFVPHMGFGDTLFLQHTLCEELTGLYYLAIDVTLYLTYKEKLNRTGVRNVNNDNAVESVSQLLYLCLLACR